MADYSKMTTEAFDQALLEVLEDEAMEGILQIPGVYEAVSEHYNNATLDRWAQEHPELAYPEDYPENDEEPTEADGELLQGFE